MYLHPTQGLVRHNVISFAPGKPRSEPPGPPGCQGLPATFHMDVRKWLAGDPRYSYLNWKKRLPKTGDAEGPQSGGDAGGGKEKPGVQDTPKLVGASVKEAGKPGPQDTSGKAAPQAVAEESLQGEAKATEEEKKAGECLKLCFSGCVLVVGHIFLK